MKPELDDDDFDQRPTVPRPVPAPLLLELSNDDFERGWIGRRPSFHSFPAALPRVEEPPPKPRLSPLVWIPMAFAACGLGALLLTRSLPTTVPSPAAKMPALIETPVDKPAPEPPKPVPPPESKVEVAKSEPVAPVAPEAKPIETKVVMEPIPAVANPIAPPANTAVAKPIAAAPPPVAVAKPMAQPEKAVPIVPAAPKPAPVANEEPAKEAPPEPPADPNGGIVNAGF